MSVPVTKENIARSSASKMHPQAVARLLNPNTLRANHSTIMTIRIDDILDEYEFWMEEILVNDEDDELHGYVYPGFESDVSIWDRIQVKIKEAIEAGKYIPKAERGE